MFFTFLQGGLQDLSDIVKLNQEIFSGIYDFEPYPLEHYQRLLQDKEVLFFLVKDNEELIASSISYLEKDYLYFWIMGVKSNYQKRGIGAKLLELNEQFAKEKKLSSVVIKVYEVSPGMIFLLEKRDYKKFKELPSEKGSKHNEIYFKLEL
jgi:ribosomal protein S18 acetylase RimI-like enzyme